MIKLSSAFVLKYSLIFFISKVAVKVDFISFIKSFIFIDDSVF